MNRFSKSLKQQLWLVFILLRVHIMLINLSILIKNQMVQLLKRIAVWDNSANVFQVLRVIVFPLYILGVGLENLKSLALTSNIRYQIGFWGFRCHSIPLAFNIS
tara:strand:- start:364 stop:675 length:312 start_codon:yes stop_codon:yes gene_type:complete